MDIQTEVLKFINRFNPKSEDVRSTFMDGCCYWFAFILRHRFFTDDSEIMYDPVANHFGTRIGDAVYDITGNVTEQYNWIPWYRIDDETHRMRIIRDCIKF